MAYIEQTARTIQIHNQIVLICKHLHTEYQGKKHGGYNIYDDGKLRLETDTYVPNVEAYVLFSGAREHVFSAGYSQMESRGGGPAVYHRGKWENYLSDLYEKALTEKARLDLEREETDKKQQEKMDAPVSAKADAIFE